jgi:hypothetical protein
VREPTALALYAPSAPLSSSANANAHTVTGTVTGTGIDVKGNADADADVDADRDVGCLYVGCGARLDVFDLTEGVRKRWKLPITEIRALAVTQDGARLFALSPKNAHVIDTATGKTTALIPFRDGDGPVTFTSDKTTGGLGIDAMGCVIDEATRSLIICDFIAHRIARVRQVDG